MAYCAYDGYRVVQRLQRGTALAAASKRTDLAAMNARKRSRSDDNQRPVLAAKRAFREERSSSGRLPERTLATQGSMSFRVERALVLAV